MSKKNNADAFLRIEQHIERWRQSLTSPTDDNRELAEEAIAGLYSRSAKLPAPLIVWCESPVQLSLIPTLVANIIQSPGWIRLVGKMRMAEKIDSESWDTHFDRQWIRIERNLVLPLLSRIWESQFPEESSQLQQRVLDRLKDVVRLILKDGRLSPDNLYSRKPNKEKYSAPEAIWPAPAENAMWKHLAKVGARVERRTSASFDLNRTSSMGLLVGEFDHRMLTQHVPGSIFSQADDDEQRTRLSEVRADCAELETIAEAQAAWLGRLLYGNTPDTEEAFASMMTEEPEDASDLVLAMKFMQGAYEGIQEVINAPRGNTNAIWGAGISWLPLAIACRILDPQLLADCEDDIDCWAYLYHAACGYLFAKNICFVCEKPVTFATHANGRPHSSTGPAAKWKDGFTTYCWRGVIIPSELIENGVLLTPQRILYETNAELRRVMLDMFGEERFLKKAGARLVHEDKYGKLYRYDFDFDEPLMMVRVSNSSREPDGTYKDYYLRVPPHMETAKQAVAWTFGVEESEYDPELES